MRAALLLLLGAVFLRAEADLVIRNAKVWTGNPQQPRAEAVAVEGKRIIAVGSNAEVSKTIGKATRVIDGQGRTVAPGFDDAHIHFLGGALRLRKVDLTGICTVKDIQAAVKAFAVANPQAEWISGGGWEYVCFPGGLPNKQMLDEVAPDRPIYLSAYDGHTGWANSKALRLAEVTKDTKWTGFGEVVKNPQTGEPTGVLKEGAQRLVARHVPPATEKDRVQALKDGMALAAKLGITGFTNASGDENELTLYRQFDKNTGLTVRANFTPSYRPGSEEQIAGWMKQYQGPHLRVVGVKFMLDGVVESYTAAMLQPYADKDTKGKLAWLPDEYKRAVAACDQQGLVVLTHAIGDAAVRLALDAYEETAQRNGARDRRHRVEHIETVQPSDIPRFEKLGVAGSFMPIHADPGTVDVWSKAIGTERLPWSFAWRSFEKAGARVVFSSDWPASISVDPLRGIHNAVNRRTLDGKPAGGWLPEQRVGLDTAMKAYTYEGAYSVYQEGERGMLKPGLLADLVLLSADLFGIQPMEIGKQRVLMTLFDGKVVYEGK